MCEQYSIAVWDIQFYKVAEDGNPLTDNKGNVQLFTSSRNMDFSWVADSVDANELEEVL
mgnify:CR=1 FL=1|jgi:hypothetical protein